MYYKTSLKKTKKNHYFTLYSSIYLILDPLLLMRYSLCLYQAKTSFWFFFCKLTFCPQRPWLFIRFLKHSATRAYPQVWKKNCENEIWQKQNKKRTIIVETEKKEKFAEKSHTELHMNTHTPMSIRRKQKTQKNCWNKKSLCWWECRKKYKIIISVKS